MNRTLQNRVARLEEEARRSDGVRYVVSDRPLSDAEWERGDRAAGARGEASLGPPLTEAEWDREFCRDARH